MRLPSAPQAILIDLAGVLYIDDEPLRGAAQALGALRASGLPIRFLTNTTRSPRSRIVAGLRQMGFAVAAEEIQTAVLATRNFVEQRKLHPHYLVHPDIADEIGRSHAEPDAVVLGDAGPTLISSRSMRFSACLCRACRSWSWRATAISWKRMV